MLGSLPGRRLTDTPFDVVLFVRSLHHAHPLSESVEQAHRLLVPEGRVIVEDFALYVNCSLALGRSQCLSEPESQHMKGELIGRGRTAEIFAWGDHQALKLFYAGWPASTAETEAEQARRIYKAGLPAPEVGDTVRVEDRYGILYERVDGPTYLQQLGTRPWLVLRMARSLAELHLEIHSSHVLRLPAQRERLEKMIKATQALPRKMTQAALDRLAQLSDGDVVCNGDFHPDNVVLSRRGPVIIDWSDATRGNPLADVARTSLLFQLANLPPHTPGRGLIEVGRAIFHRLYLRRYFQLQSASRDELRAWQLPVAVARLSEGLAEEETRLLLMIAGSFTDH
jgi:uncharacterized protein (TIGR02172 family)